MFITREIQGRMKAPKVDGIILSREQRPVDYGHCEEIMKEKYGPVRGARMYQDLIDSDKKGIQFVIATKIMKEKEAMARKLVMDSNTSYQFLWDKWMGHNQLKFSL